MRGRSGAMPELVAPMLPVRGELPEGPGLGDWAVEFAWDGHRCLAHVRPDRASLHSGTGRAVTTAFPELVGPLARRAPRRGMVLDGTVVALGDGVFPRRRALMRRSATQRPSEALVRRTPVGYFVSDVLWLDGQDTTALPYRDRRELLAGLGLARRPVVLSPSFPAGEVSALMAAAESHGADALHAKHLDAPYRPGKRTRAWLRVPLRRVRRVVVGGWNPADPRRPETVGALLLGVPAPGGLRYVGRAGLAAGERRELAEVLAAIRRPRPPFVAPLPAAVAAHAVWADPRLEGLVEFTDWAPDGRLRTPVWRGAAEPTSTVAWAEPPAPPAEEAAAPPSAAEPAAPPPADDPPAEPPADAGSPGRPDDRTVRQQAPTAPAATARNASMQAPGRTAQGGVGPDDTSARTAPADPPQARPATAGAGSAGAPVPDGGSAAVEARRLEQHFVYNSLNTIASLVRTDPGRARDLLLGFADLTRAADQAGGPSSTLGRELAAVAAYLKLEQARFGRRLAVDVEVDSALHGVAVPPMRVLAAVRAVVQQRIEPRPGGGTLVLRAEPAGGGVVVQVGEHGPEGPGGPGAAAPVVLRFDGG